MGPSERPERLGAGHFFWRGRLEELRELDRLELPPRRGRYLAKGIFQAHLRIDWQAIADFQGGIVRTFNRLDDFQKRYLIRGPHQGIAAIDTTGRTQNAVRYEVPQDLQQEPLRHFAFRSQPATRHRPVFLELCELQCCANGIRYGAGELH